MHAFMKPVRKRNPWSLQDDLEFGHQEEWKELEKGMSQDKLHDEA